MTSEKRHLPCDPPGGAPAPQALRRGLPYGAVMATGAAAQLAGACRLTGAVRPLLWLAVGEALWICGRGMARHRRELRLPISAWLGLGPSGEHTGVLTVPLGLAVVATGLSTQHGEPAATVGVVCFVLAWLGAAVFLGRFVASIVRCHRAETVDGGWFLAPAALLGAGIAAAARVPHASGAMHDVLQWASLLAAAAGVVGYWAVAAAAAARVTRRGLGDDRRVLWWIAAGCGGLAAASVGRALAADDSYWPLGISVACHIAAAATWALAAALAVPIVIESLRWLSGTRRIVRLAPWPPTFSTAVFALGGLATGAMFHAHAITMIGKAAGFATLALWAITAGLHATRAIPTRRGRRRGVGGLQRTAGAPPRRPAAGAAQETWDREDADAGATIALIVEP